MLLLWLNVRVEGKHLIIFDGQLLYILAKCFCCTLVVNGLILFLFFYLDGLQSARDTSHHLTFWLTHFASHMTLVNF